jgi:rfaE bifunctional protein kinase chain/domain
MSTTPDRKDPRSGARLPLPEALAGEAFVPAQLGAARVLVVGDVMLDRYWFGDAERVSPEAPVPVVRVAGSEERLGGAANVARNITALGAHAALLAVVGDDEAGVRLRTLAAESGIDGHLQTDPGLPTTVKLRIVARRQQLVRLDFEAVPVAEALQAHLSRYESLLASHDLVVLSDYGKGGLTHIRRMIEIAQAAGRPVLVDPKGDDYARYAGATLLTPNRAELREVVGRWRDEAELQDRAQALRERLGLQALLLTRSEEGMTLFTQSGAWSIGAQAREVFDVSGAGDTVIAVAAALLALGRPLREAVTLANRAGGIVVGKLGTATVTAAELFGPQGH